MAATVTIEKSYFQALLRRAEFHSNGHGFDPTKNWGNQVTISKAEHNQLLRSAREYGMVLFL
ncbi:hypothetical protein GQ43DRAFT_442650 [Delitschia confertaspora ATCC 74209]|uniref:Uncharacterized protein n=1 Tax=Delitschia confertaspora ATCC 74209 TaxID=1513339 RepID=A0A9P4MNA4_9PLEO|nr:hypothetical protein GQ43DRAFT_442650 [Delitschia confertaspora ATCC 74209]